MKTLINFTTSSDDLSRYRDTEDLRQFCRQYHCDGLELMPMGTDAEHFVPSDLVVGIHANCYSDWMDMDRASLINHYRKDLDFARNIQAEYVVFHVTQVSF